MLDFCVISVREDASVRDSGRDEVSRPIYNIAHPTSVDKCPNFGRTFTGVIVMSIFANADFCLMTPSASRVPIESMNEYNTAYS